MGAFNRSIAWHLKECAVSSQELALGSITSGRVQLFQHAGIPVCDSEFIEMHY
jgi:hypothetical protein